MKVKEASEPNAVRWMDLNYNDVQISIRQYVTFCVTLGLVILSGWVLYLARTKVNTAFFTVILSTFNFLIPLIVRILVSHEKHYDEGSLQRSLYIKITFFRWVSCEHCIDTHIFCTLL